MRGKRQEAVDDAQREHIRQESRAWAAGGEPVCGGGQAQERRVTSVRAVEIKGTTSACMEQGSSAGAAGNKRAGGENGRRSFGAHDAGTEGPGGGGGSE
jgi:hypothetical protein